MFTFSQIKLLLPENGASTKKSKKVTLVKLFSIKIDERVSHNDAQ